MPTEIRVVARRGSMRNGAQSARTSASREQERGGGRPRSSYTDVSDGLAGPQASGSHRCRALRWNGGRHPRHADRRPRPRAGSVRRLHARARDRELRPAPARHDRRGGDRQVRDSLHGDERLGPAARALPGRARRQVGRRSGRDGGRPRARAVLGRPLRPARPDRAARDRRLHPARAGAGGHRRRLDDRRRPLRPARDLRRARPGLRLVGVAVGVQYGVTWAVVGILVGQILGSCASGYAGHRLFSRYPVGRRGSASAATGRARSASSSSRASARRSSRCETRSPRSPSASSRRSRRSATSAPPRRPSPGSRRSRPPSA